MSTYTELDLFEWKKWKFANKDFWIDPIADTVPRIDGLTVPKQEFIDKYEQPELPVVILNLTKGWLAEQTWNREVRDHIKFLILVLDSS